MAFIKRIIVSMIKQLFPNFYWKYREKHFDTSSVIYKKKSYKSFLDEAFQDFRPNILPSERKKIEHDMLLTFLKDRTRPDEFLLYHFDTMGDSERQEYLTQASKDRLLVSYYKGDVKNTIGILRDKYAFYQIAKDYFRRDVVLISKETNNFDEFRLFCSKHPKFIAKEVDGGCGVGIKLMDVNSYGSIDEAYTDLLTTGTWILEELILQNEEMAAFNSSSVNTVRFPSFRHGKNVVAALPCMRFGRKGNFVDNAGSRGVFVSVDLETGEVITDAFDERGHRYKTHPDSNKKFIGFKVPQWKELVEVAREAHLSLPENQVYVAFDFALSDKGWVIVEGNWGDWVLQEVSLERGLAKEFRELLNG